MSESAPKLKSALSRRAGDYGDSKTGVSERDSNGATSKRRISFNENRVEISPEETPSETEDMSTEVAPSLQVKRLDFQEASRANAAAPTPIARPRTSAARVEPQADDTDDEMDAILAASSRPVTSESGNRVEELTRLIEHKLDKRGSAPAGSASEHSGLKGSKEPPKSYALPTATLTIESDSDESVHV